MVAATNVRAVRVGFSNVVTVVTGKSKEERAHENAERRLEVTVGLLR